MSILRQFSTILISVAIVLSLGSGLAYANETDGSANLNVLTTANAAIQIQASENEPNDAISTATAVSLNASNNGQITNDDKDYYRFTLPTAGKVSLTGTSYLWITVARIYDSSGTEVWAEGWNVWDSNTERYVLNWNIDLTAGTYYLALWGGNGSTGSYNFKLAFTSAQESFSEIQGGSNNSIESASAIALGSSYNGQIASNDDKDYYRFTLPSSGRISITGISKLWITVCRIYDESGAEVWAEGWNVWDSNSERYTMDWSVDLAKGTYYFAVWGGNGSTGNYSYKLSFTSANESFDESQNAMKNTLESAPSITTGTTYYGQIAANDDKDYFKFTVPTSSKIAITGTSYLWITVCRIYDSSGKETWAEGWNVWDDSSKRYSMSWSAELAAGTYYFSVSGGNGSTGPYSFRINRIIDISSAQVSGITSKTYNGTPLTQNITVKVAGVALKAGTEYGVTYANNKKAGTASLTITGRGTYTGSLTRNFTINKAANTLTASAKTKTIDVKYSKLKKKNQTIAKSKAFKLSGNKGAVTFKKLSGNKKISVSKAGTITVKKGLKKNTYTVKVRVKAAGDGNYKAKSVDISLKIRVK